MMEKAKTVTTQQRGPCQLPRKRQFPWGFYTSLGRRSEARYTLASKLHTTKPVKQILFYRPEEVNPFPQEDLSGKIAARLLESKQIHPCRGKGMQGRGGYG